MRLTPERIRRLKESGGIEFAADWLFSLSGDPTETDLVVQRKLTLLKAGHGQSGLEQVVDFDRPHIRFGLGG